jgi:acetyl esterase
LNAAQSINFLSLESGKVPLDPGAARFLAMLAAANPPNRTDRSLQAYRNGFAQLGSFADAPQENLCLVEDASLALEGRSIAVRIYSRPLYAAEPPPSLIWFHGGGWIAGSLQTSDPLCRLLAQESGRRVIAVDYRLAPEFAFPAGLQDCCESVLAIATRGESYGVRKNDIAVGGESAGAHLAVAACQFARDRGVCLSRQLLLCPVIDPLGDWPSRRTFSKGYLLEETAISDYVGFYGLDLDRADPRLSPLRSSDFHNLPPADIHTAEYDPVRDEGAAYAAALTAAAVPVRYVCHPGMIHNFYSLGGVIPEARKRLAAIGTAFGTA